MATPPTTAVVLMNLGGPDSLEAVEPFLYNIFSDPDVIQLPLGFLWQKAFARRLSRARAPESRANYEKIGGRSPILALTREQGTALEGALGEGFRTYVGMRAWHPFLEEAVERLLADGAERVVALPLFPQRSRTTSLSASRELRRALAARAPGLPLHEVCCFPALPGLLAAWTKAIRRTLDSLPPGRQERAHVLFSAHGLPRKLVDRGDPYLAHVQATVAGVMARLPLGLSHSLAFQSRATRVKWLEPSTPDALAALAAGGVEDVVVVPISFVTEHVETLFELDLLIRDQAVGAGLRGYHRVPVPHLDPELIAGLAGLVRDVLVPDRLRPCGLVGPQGRCPMAGARGA
jgi:ferrochelatase